MNFKRLVAAGIVVAMPALCAAASHQIIVKAVNKLPIARPNQTIELSAGDLAPLGNQDLEKVHVLDGTGKEVLCQAMDVDYDEYRKPDILIFQADFAPNETKTFNVMAGAKQVYTKDQFKAHGRFVRERCDDFAWENDRIAHRTYGKALETFPPEPLTGSGIDVWSKRTSRMVIDEWYMVDNYHVDTGEGFDDYTSGTTRGCGGTGLWADERLWVSRNFVQSRVLANGPIRVLFELTYEPFDVNGISVAETKRISLDAGQHLGHFQSFYQAFTRPEKPVKLTAVIGLKKVAGEQRDFSADRGWLVSWEDMEKNAGKQGVAVVFDPKIFEKLTEDKANHLIVCKLSNKNGLSYWAGFCWDKAGQFTNGAAWKTYVEEFEQGLESPVEVSVSVE